jgi:hypothetical protein
MLNQFIDFIIVCIIIYLILNLSCNCSTFFIYTDSFENDIKPNNKTDIKTDNVTLVNPENKPTDNKLTNEVNYKIPEVEKNIKSKNINQNYNNYSSTILDNLKKNQHLLNDRYNLLKIHYYDKDLQNEMLSNEYLNELENDMDNDKPNYNSLNVIILDNDIDSKILNKSKRCQKSFKDSKTIASRFNKNTLKNNYIDELDYYEKIKTPWWSEDIDYD